MLGPGDIDQKSQDGGHVDPVGNFVAGKHLLSVQGVDAENPDEQARHGKHPTVVVSAGFEREQCLEGVNELEGDDDQAGKQDDQIGVGAHGQVGGFDHGPPVDGVGEPDKDECGQDVGREQVPAIETGDPGADLEGRAHPLDHQLQAVGLHGQKAEKDQGVRQPRQFLSPYVGLAQHILEQHADTPADLVQLEFRGAFDRHHQAVEPPDPNGEKGEGPDQGNEHDKRFDDGILFHE